MLTDQVFQNKSQQDITKHIHVNITAKYEMQALDSNQQVLFDISTGLFYGPDLPITARKTNDSTRKDQV